MVRMKTLICIGFKQHLKLGDITGNKFLALADDFGYMKQIFQIFHYFPTPSKILVNFMLILYTFTVYKMPHVYQQKALSRNY